jgi:ribosome-associated protein
VIGSFSIRSPYQESPLNKSLETPPADLAVPAGGDELAGLEALIVSRLDEDKAEDIVLIDLKGKSPLADAMVVATGRSARHVAAMADHLTRALKEGGFGKAQVEGLPHADWVLIDAGDVIVHLFRPEVRSFYQIEKIWSLEPPTPRDRSAWSAVGSSS